MKKFLSLSFLLVLISTSIWSQVLDNEVQSKVLGSVFEIVVDKVEDPNITYEKKLPFERLPFSIRNDKFIPIGTAFLLEDGTFYSASHVFELYGETNYTNYYIRDINGATYKIEDITSLSNTRDYISFTVPQYPVTEKSGLKISTDFEMNSTVFSVGNAQGQGIIIRNGVLTSQTAEDLNGEWKWIRFTAAASPGNSGGPLIKEDGSVIGIITMKNETENLNYALPIAETTKKSNEKGYIYSQFHYRLPNILNYREYCEFSYEISLPKSYTELHAELTKAYKDYLVEVVKIMRKSYNPGEEKSYTKSKEYPLFAYNAYFPDTPLTIYLNESGAWDMGYGTSKTFQLDNNGSIEYTSLMNYYIFTIKRPDNVSLEELITNPTLYMDWLVELMNLYRSVGSENVNIKSLGKPCKSETYKDYFGRTWYANYYSVDFADSMILTYALPLPTGMYVMYKLATRKSITSSHYLDMQFVADHTYTDYFGCIKDWKEYLSLSESIMSGRSDFEKEFKLDCSEEKLTFSTKDIKITITPDMLNYDEETRIDVSTSFNIVDGKPLMENRGCILYSKPKSEDYKYIGIKRVNKPLDGATKKTKQDWEMNYNKISPMNGEPYNYEQYTYMNETVILDEATLYQLSFELLNQNMNEEIKAFAESVKEKLELNK